MRRFHVPTMEINEHIENDGGGSRVPGGLVSSSGGDMGLKLVPPSQCVYTQSCSFCQQQNESGMGFFVPSRLGALRRLAELANRRLERLLNGPALLRTHEDGHVVPVVMTEGLHGVGE